MCNGYYIIITATMSQAFFDKFEVSFIFLKKRLDIVFFLYFYRLHRTSPSNICYLFIILAFISPYFSLQELLNIRVNPLEFSFSKSFPLL